MGTMKPWQRVRLFAEKHGVKFLIWEHIPKHLQSPFDDTIGCSWLELELHLQESARAEPGTVGGLIHELGHLLAMPVPPNQVDGEESFVLWERGVAKQIGVFRQWLLWMKGYSTDLGDYGDLTPRQQVRWYEQARAAGLKAGNINEKGLPLHLRGVMAQTNPLVADHEAQVR